MKEAGLSALPDGPESITPAWPTKTLAGALVARFAELWLVQGYAEYDFDEAGEQLTRLWCNALGLESEPAAR